MGNTEGRLAANDTVEEKKKTLVDFLYKYLALLPLD